MIEHAGTDHLQALDLIPIIPPLQVIDNRRKPETRTGAFLALIQYEMFCIVWHVLDDVFYFWVSRRQRDQLGLVDTITQIDPIRACIECTIFMSECRHGDSP